MEGKQLKLYKIRDLRQKEKFVVDDAYITDGYSALMGPTTTAVYISLCRHVDKEQQCFPAQEKIAGQHNISIPTVRRAIRKLKEANIISVEQEKTEQGKWLNNIYILLDKSQWKAPGIISDLRKHRGSKTTKTGDHQVPNKVTHIKETHIIAGKPAGNEINELIELFKEVNPNYEILFKNKNQRAALERMVKKFGREKVENGIKILPKIINRPYAPRITTPIQFEIKLGELKAFYSQEKSKVENKSKIKSVKV